MKILENKLRLSSIIYYLVIIVFTSVLLISISSRSDRLYNIIRLRTYTVLSGSMEPEFYPGDMVVVTKPNTSKLVPNDIITFKTDNEIVTHRIIEKTPEGFITQGDNNNVADSEMITPENIIGEVAFSIPKAGYVAQFLSQGWVVGVEMVLLGAFIFLYNKDDKEDNDDKDEETSDQEN